MLKEKNKRLSTSKRLNVQALVRMQNNRSMPNTNLHKDNSIAKSTTSFFSKDENVTFRETKSTHSSVHSKEWSSLIESH